MLINAYIIGVILLLLSLHSGHAQGEPWSMDKSLGFPDWLSITVKHRTRYESLDNQYRAKVNGSSITGGDQALVFRTLVHGRIRLDQLVIGAEMIDSRIKLADSGSATSGTRLTTTITNPLELLQAYLEIPLHNRIGENSSSTLRGGRMTMDVGSRRLVARNRYRNTINAFTGVDWQWRQGETMMRAFYTLPVQRRVDGDIINNRPAFDQEDSAIRFWGLYYRQPLFSSLDHSEFFLFGLNEDDSETLVTRNRQLYTFGIRQWRNPETSRFDYQMETVYQLGESRTSVQSTSTLDHRAHFHHGEIGYSMAAPWSPRIVAQFDYASGDNDPDDNENNRFDTLYGARRFDFGPTSIYGAFARANLLSPGLRLMLKPSATVDAMLVARGFWRASRHDVWQTAGINGQSRYIGTQLELRARWDPVPKNLRLESGVAYLVAGELMNEAGKQNTAYVYTQVSVSF